MSWSHLKTNLKGATMNQGEGMSIGCEFFGGEAASKKMLGGEDTKFTIPMVLSKLAHSNWLATALKNRSVLMKLVFLLLSGVFIIN